MIPSINIVMKIKNKYTDIIHMAAHSDVTYCNLNPTKCYELNVKSTQKMLEIARKNDSNFIFLSSSHVYGNPIKQPIIEDSLCNPSTHYASSKRMSEILCETYARTYGLNIRIARIFSVYGPNSSKSNLIFNIINQAIHNSQITLGNITPKRDFIFIDEQIGKDPDQRNYIVSNEKIESTGYKTEFTLERGIGELIKGYNMIQNSRYGNV